MNVRMRILAFHATQMVAMALALPALYDRLLRLQPAQSRAVAITFFGLCPLAILVVGAVLWLGVRGEDEDYRRRVLQAPARLAVAQLGVGLVALISLMAQLAHDGAPAPIAVGLMLGTGALLLLPPVPLHAFARVTLLPVALRMGDETRPKMRKVSLATELGYAIASVAAAALVPAAVFGSAQLDVSAAADARARAISTGLRMARAAADLDVASATVLITRTPLSGGERLLYRAPSGSLFPEDAVAEVESSPFVEVPLEGALRGGSLRVHYAARPRARAPLLASTLVLLCFTALVAWLIGRGVADDVAAVDARIRRVARDEEPGPVPPILTAEVRRLLSAANRLLERVPRFTVESFLAIERAEEAQRLKSQFLANMSHDLRSPLNSILGFSELLLRGIEGPITEAQKGELEIIQERGNQLLRQLTEILDTAKLESGKMELHKQASPPVELLRAAIQEARRGRPAEVADGLTVALQPGLGPMHVDPLRVTQAITHLVDHALDLRRPEGRPVKVIVRAREAEGPTGRLFVVEMEHDGPLGADNSAALFDAFRRLPGATDLNLALPLARRLAELHGGTLELASSAPVRLRMTLPVARG